MKLGNVFYFINTSHLHGIFRIWYNKDATFFYG